MPFNLSAWGAKTEDVPIYPGVHSEFQASQDYIDRSHLKIKILKKNKGVKKAGNMALSVKYLSCKHEDLNLIPRTYIFKIQV